MKSSYPKFQKPSPEIEKRIDGMIAKLSLEEKIRMIGGKHNSTYGVEHAGIPEFHMADGPNGVHWWCDYSTAYPTSVCTAAGWDSSIAKKVGEGLGKDCRARGVHYLLAPGVNIYRSPLCGRNFEYFGEDPYLTSRMAVSYITGVQSQGVSATLKHFAVNYQEFDRHKVSSDVDERTLHELYLPAFKAAVKEAGTAAVMCSYNLVNGVHASESTEIIDILKKDWGFDGVYMSDWVATYSADGAANAGLDLEMPAGKWMNADNLVPMVKDGTVKESVIDDKVRRILRVAACFGWLDNDQKDEFIPLRNPETEAIALEAARGGIVLLKNEESILPFDAKAKKKIALIGSQTTDPSICGGGSAYSPAPRVVSLYDALKEMVGDEVEILQSGGIDLMRGSKSCETSEYTTVDGRKGMYAEFYRNTEFDGEPEMTRVDETMLLRLRNRPPAEGWPISGYSVRWTGQVTAEEATDYRFYVEGPHKDTKLLLNGVPLPVDKNSIGYRCYWGTAPLEKGTNDVVVEFVKNEGWTDFGLGYERADAIGKEKDDAREIAKNADIVVQMIGFDHNSEREGADRTFEIAGPMLEQLRETAEINDNLIVVITSGGGIDMAPWMDKAKAIIQAWYLGQEGGTALAEVLTGAVNPSGKLPMTLDKRLEDRSSFDCYHDDDDDKRVELTDGIFSGYRHNDRSGIEPLFPFGFGLSYTTFAYDNLQLSAEEISEDSLLTVSVEVTNSGDRDGAEVVQVYVSDMESSLERPVKELKGFAKVMLKAGETKTVSVDLDADAFKYYDPKKHDWVLEEGDFEILVAASATDVRLKATVAYAEEAVAAD